jgi:hypothetical protein
MPRAFQRARYYDSQFGSGIPAFLVLTVFILAELRVVENEYLDS